MVNFTNAEACDFLDDYGSLTFIINSLINRVNTTEIVKVVSINTDENNVFDGTINVVPVVKRLTAEGEAIEESVIYGIKCFGWQFGENAIKSIPAVNDIGIMVVSKRDITSIESGRVASNRQYCLADGIYIGGLVGFNATPKRVITFDDNGITIDTGDKDLTINTTKATVNATSQIDVVAPTVNIGDATSIVNLGGAGGKGVARIGDSIDVVNGVIVGGSAKIFAVD